MASPLASPTFLFPSMGTPQSPKDNGNGEPRKPIENPLLLRPPPQYQNNNISSVGIGEERSPLHALNNHQGQGLRQRKRPVLDSTFAPPPKASLSVMGYMAHPSTDQDYSTTSVPDLVDQPQPSNSNSDDASWVVVFGYATKPQYDQLVQLFHSFGRVVKTNGSFGSSSNCNCIAFCYQSQLQAEKALCHNPIQLSQTVLCGVVRLTPSLRASMDWNHHRPGGDSSSSSSSGGDILFASHESSSVPMLLTNGHAETPNIHNTNTHNTGLQEKDILLYSDDDAEDRARRSSRDKNVCEHVLAWWFGWE